MGSPEGMECKRLISGRSKVIIIGWQIRGLSAAQALKSAPVDITLIVRRTTTCFDRSCIELPPVRFHLVKSPHHCEQPRVSLTAGKRFQIFLG